MKRDSSGNGTDGPPSKFQRPAADVSHVILRFLIPCRAAGIMIGKGGENIKKIRSQYNVKLNIPDNRGPERIMTIEGDLDAICSIMKEASPKLKDIMNAKLSDPKRIMGNLQFRRRPRPGAEDEPERDDDEDDSMLDYRILVHESQAGSVIGRGGERIKELRDKYKMRVIKVYQLLAPMSTDRVVQMVAEPDNAIACLKSVVEAVESAPPRGRREDYDAANFCEADALNYGGFLSREALHCLNQGLPIPRTMPMGPYGGGPYGGGGGMGGPMGPGPGPMPGGMGPMGGGMGPAGGRAPVGGGRNPMGVGRGGRQGGMMGSGGPRSAGGPAPVPPPSGPRGAPPPAAGASGAGYGGPGASSGYGGPGYDAPCGYDGSLYASADPSGASGYGGPGFGGSSGGGPGAAAYGSGAGYGSGSARGGDVPPSGSAPRGSYGGYGMAAPGMHDDAKVSQWYGGWS